MKILNVGAGGCRPGDPFINLDNLHAQFPIGRPERAALDREPNYVNHDIGSGPLPFHDQAMDAVLLAHCLEHFDVQSGLELLRQCRRVLMIGGSLVLSVPDAAYFRSVDAEDRNENWPSLFGQTDPKNPIPTFREAALFFNEHKVILTEDAVWCYLRQSGFEPNNIVRIQNIENELVGPALQLIAPLLNRRQFSLFMLATK